MGFSKEPPGDCSNRCQDGEPQGWCSLRVSPVLTVSVWSGSCINTSPLLTLSDAGLGSSAEKPQEGFWPIWAGHFPHGERVLEMMLRMTTPSAS